jgi:SAM-dependent methyltransferase
MAKVLLALHICQKAGISLKCKSIFDYGFGAGTFFRYCPRSSRLTGVEIDPVNVEEVENMLRDRGFSNIDLRPIEIEHWSEHPLLKQRYDVILCSHVLEHLADPVAFLRKIKACLSGGGKFVGLVPLNERKPDFHHVQAVDKQGVEDWAKAASMRVVAYLETDHWGYWIQPWLIHERGLAHKCDQAVSLLLGIPSSLIGPAAWWPLSRIFSTLTRSKPTQAAFVLKNEAPD